MIRPTVDDLFTADTAAYRRGQADAFDLDADALDDLADALPDWIDELGLEEACARLRLVAGHSRAYADQVRASAPRWARLCGP